VPDVFLLLLRHPHPFWAWLRFASKLMPFGTLDRRDAELVILRVAWNCSHRFNLNTITDPPAGTAVL
jgi:hypothetical protein